MQYQKNSPIKKWAEDNRWPVSTRKDAQHR